MNYAKHGVFNLTYPFVVCTMPGKPVHNQHRRRARYMEHLIEKWIDVHTIIKTDTEVVLIHRDLTG